MMFISNLARSKGDPKVLQSGPSSLGFSDRMARNLGWFSMGLGLMELIAPSRVTRFLGLYGQEGLVRAYGLREIASGMLSLSVDKRAGLWSRVAGDGLDIAMLIANDNRWNPKRRNLRLALLGVLGIAVLDIVAAEVTTVRHKRPGVRRLYRDRTGFPKTIDAVRGIAKASQAPSHRDNNKRTST
jgi:hypothetical protein